MIDNRLHKFTEKRILVFVAHPDDESLYFFSGIKLLSSIADLRVLCATYTRESLRGNELSHFCVSMNIQCDFLGVSDLGFDSILFNLKNDLKNYLLRNKFDLIITHAPHGGEKPHPHHLQCFLAALCLSTSLSIQFGFFSEIPISLCQQVELNRFKIKTSKLFYLNLATVTKIKWKYKLSWIGFFIFQFLNITYSSKRLKKIFFNRLELCCDIREKKAALERYQSQKNVLQFYKTSNSDREFLFTAF